MQGFKKRTKFKTGRPLYYGDGNESEIIYDGDLKFIEGANVVTHQQIYDKVNETPADLYSPDYLVSTYSELVTLLEEMRTTNDHPMGWVHIKGSITPTDTIQVPNCPLNKSFKLTGGNIVPLTDRSTITFSTRTWGANPSYAYNVLFNDIAFSGQAGSIGNYPLIDLPDVIANSFFTNLRFSGQSALITTGHRMFKGAYVQQCQFKDCFYEAGYYSTNCYLLEINTPGGTPGVLSMANSIVSCITQSGLYYQVTGRLLGIMISNNNVLTARNHNMVKIDALSSDDAKREMIHFVDNKVDYLSTAPSYVVDIPSTVYGYHIISNTIVDQLGGIVGMVNQPPDEINKSETHNVITT